MSTEGSHLISFQHWDIGERKIRYICIGDNDDFSLKMTSFGEKRLIPLFLGADVYSDTDIRVGNHPRYHAKFAKKGLATKLVFPPEYRFHGLRVTCGMNSLWFYSIQGIFRVAFELYSKQEQLSVLETLQELLKSRLNDDPLKMTYQLTKRLDNPESHSETTDTSHLHTEVIMDNPVGEQACISQETDPDESASLELPEDTSSDDHDYCSSVKTATCETFSQACKISQTLQNLESQLQTIAIVESQQKQILSSCLRLLECCSNSLTDDEEQLAKAVLALLQLRTPSALSTYCSPLLQVVAGWLGQCFHAANSCISQQVEGFKVRHIEHISDLPPAEELAAELFPEAMRTLLVNWMGLGEEAAPWKRHSEFPILLLILEFANHNLITGVAHVLYSSLICK